MKANEMVRFISRIFHKAGFRLQKSSPEILVAAGIVGAVVSAALACKATIKAAEVAEETKKNGRDDS